MPGNRNTALAVTNSKRGHSVKGGGLLFNTVIIDAAKAEWVEAIYLEKDLLGK